MERGSTVQRRRKIYQGLVAGKQNKIYYRQWHKQKNHHIIVYPCVGWLLFLVRRTIDSACIPCGSNQWLIMRKLAPQSWQMGFCCINTRSQCASIRLSPSLNSVSVENLPLEHETIHIFYLQHIAVPIYSEENAKRLNNKIIHQTFAALSRQSFSTRKNIMCLLVVFVCRSIMQVLTELLAFYLIFAHFT